MTPITSTAKFCEICGTEFRRSARAGNAKWARSRYCSRDCAEKGQLWRRSSKPCLRCGTVFGLNLRPRDFRRSVYCSRECSEASLVPPPNLKHGCAQRQLRYPEYCIWVAMKQRCLNPLCAAYSYYGGRGITVCASWVSSFETFLKDVGRRPSPELTLERKDNNLGYSPENVCWATWKDQASNKRKRSSRK